LFFLNPSLMSVLLDDARGRFMMGMALLSLAIGVSVMAVIIKRSLR
jgi:Flp pilus assembly protein TadB